MMTSTRFLTGKKFLPHGRWQLTPSMKNEQDVKTISTIGISFRGSNFVSQFFGLLQGGFRISAGVGCSIKDFLVGQCCLEEAYINGRISTIFLDAKPVDDIDTAIIENGSTLALSGAMPGLVGAVMRRGSAYSSFRSTISYSKGRGESPRKDGIIRVKLFNIILNELGPFFLEGGILVSSDDLREFLSGKGDDFLRGITELTVDQRVIEPGLIRDRGFLPEGGNILLSVTGYANISEG